jgi:hypothetical protein
MIISLSILPALSQQPLITVQYSNGDSTSLFNTLPEAIAFAPANSNLYLSGGNFSAFELIINKRLNIYGAGHYPDSSHATGVTYLTGNIYFCNGSDSSYVTGIYFMNGVFVGSNSDNQLVNGLNFKRCRFDGTLQLAINGNFPEGKGHLISENVIWNLHGEGTQNCIVEKNIINAWAGYFNSNNLFTNNIFLGYANSIYDGVNNCFFQNNIFSQNIAYSPLNGATYCNFQNNLFVSDITFPNGSNTGTNNIVSQPIESIYNNYTAWNNFLYTSNYHLQPTCPGVGAGTDGTDIGIYGTTYPYKDGGIPINPHIRISNIPLNTSNGKLPVHIEVDAQTK